MIFNKFSTIQKPFFFSLLVFSPPHTYLLFASLYLHFLFSFFLLGFFSSTHVSHSSPLYLHRIPTHIHPVSLFIFCICCFASTSLPTTKLKSSLVQRVREIAGGDQWPSKRVVRRMSHLLSDKRSLLFI